MKASFKLFVGVAAGILVMLAARQSSAVVYNLPVSDIQAMIDFNSGGPGLGGTGVVNSVTPIANGADFNVTGGASGDTKITFGIQYSPQQDLTAYDSLDYTFKWVSTDGATTDIDVQPFIQSGNPNFVFRSYGDTHLAPGASNAFDLSINPPPPTFTKNTIFRVGIQVFNLGPGENGVFEVTSVVPEPATLTLIGLAVPGLVLAGRKLRRKA
jgi:hypothetical protein